jgi:hypothetical protein
MSSRFAQDLDVAITNECGRLIANVVIGGGARPDFGASLLPRRDCTRIQSDPGTQAKELLASMRNTGLPHSCICASDLL